MANTNYTSQLIQSQLANRSGQISRKNAGGSYSYIDDLNGLPLNAVPAASNILANPQRINDPRIKAQALDLARGYYGGNNVPPEMIEAIATVAAYVSAVNGVSVGTLFSENGISLQLISAYNAFKPKGSQVGVLQANRRPAWVNNPTLRGSISAAITDQS